MGGSFYHTPGTLTSKTSFTLQPGFLYELSFDLGSNAASGMNTETVEVSLAGVYSELFSVPPSTSLAPLTRTITVNSPTVGKLTIRDVGSAGLDSEGAILDDVRLTEQVVPTPEPATLGLLGLATIALFVPILRRGRVRG